MGLKESTDIQDFNQTVIHCPVNNIHFIYTVYWAMNYLLDIRNGHDVLTRVAIDKTQLTATFTH